MKNIIIFISGLLLVTSCKTTPKETLTTLFPDTESLTPTSLNISSDDILEPVLLVSIDSFLICTNHLADKIFRIYNLQNGQVLNDIISVGKAENELLDAASVWLSQDSLNVYSTNSGKILHFPLNQLSVANPNITATRFPPKYLNLTCCIQNNYYSGMTWASDSTKNQFDLLDRNGKKLNSFGPYYQHSDPQINSRLDYVYQGKLNTNHEGTKIFYASYFGSILKFFDSSDPLNIELVKEYHFSDPTLASTSGQHFPSWGKDCQRGALATTSNAKCCFVLCEEGKLVSDPNWRMSTVYCFDWEGNPLKKLDLGRNIQTITYNESRNQLIALTVNDQEEYSFVAYDL